MRICFLAPANSAHTVKWCRYFAEKGHEVHVISFTEGEIEGVRIHLVSSGAAAGGGDMQKLLYLTGAGKVRKLVREITPDVLNVHYATSYGTVAALAGCKNYVLSVWGSDIFVFPKKSPIHRLLLQCSLRRAQYLFSTSRAMAEEAGKYTKKHFEITPFGVDLQLFSPEKRRREENDFRVGTVKTLAPAYGIDTLLKAVSIVRTEHPEIPLRLRIAGSGPQEAEYHELAKNLGIESLTDWLGFLPQARAAEEWANMDLAVICSNSESFGVAAVEAQACACPVIISDLPGLMEATDPEKTAVVVPKGNAKKLAEAIIMLYNAPERRKEMGKCGRVYVEEHYELTNCFEKVEKIFCGIVKSRNL